MAATNDDEDCPDRPFHSRQSTPPLAEEGLELMEAFQKIASRADRNKVVALARKLSGRK